MGEFPMCDACRYEYTHAETRRYDAQPVCCQDCGPEVYLIGRGERRREAITAVRRILSDGGIAAGQGESAGFICAVTVRVMRQSGAFVT
jgi:hydrogenase maturation protein HypF